MNLEKIYQSKSLNPWVFVTYDCSCKCPYCMIPEMKCNDKTMSSETFRKMLEITEKLLEKDVYNQVHFRLSGGEPFLVFDNYKEIVTEYRKRYPNQINFGILTNFVKFDDKIADWMELNNIGMQVSLDDLENGKPLANGKSSSEAVLKNIQKLQSRNIRFSINTVLDIDKTKDLTKLANFVSSFRNAEWGLNASYTENDPNKTNEVIKIFDDCIFQLVKCGFDIQNKLRFYNTVVGQNRGGCSAGVNSFAIGTNLELWSCQSLCDKKHFGCFNENIKDTLMNAPDNVYFRERRLRPECSDCPVLGLCRGGCRATHNDDNINETVCQIRINIIGKLSSGYYYKRQSGNTCNYNNTTCPIYNLNPADSKNNHAHEGLETILNKYTQENKTTEEVETPLLD
ncbi:MAG: radical SAM protein [Treponema sp.]|nr:radical SAM protein [Treponema sp.]MCL2272489.1 radical SAM protein [Treponema sp.]